MRGYGAICAGLGHEGAGRGLIGVEAAVAAAPGSTEREALGCVVFSFRGVGALPNRSGRRYGHVAVRGQARQS